MEYQCYTERDAKTKSLFLQLPKRLYPQHSPQDMKREKQILQGTHPLSRMFQVFPFVVVRHGVPICRSLLTLYEGDERGYAGFFEAEDDLDGVRYLFDVLGEKAREHGKSALVGPLDASIFLNYRFKLDHFDHIDLGEPVHLPYYPRLWESCGFQIQDTYVSNRVRRVTASDRNMRYEQVYQRYLKKGYAFISPTHQTFPRILSDVYWLLMDLYAEFPGYKRVDEEQFRSLFGNLKWVLNYDMVRLAYRAGRLYGFCICVPNYKDLTLGSMTPLKWLRIQRVRHRPTEYVVLYMGASKAAPGLGCALIQEIRNRLYQNQCTAIGAFIHTGNLTGTMYEELYTDQRHYALYQKEIQNPL